MSALLAGPRPPANNTEGLVLVGVVIAAVILALVLIRFWLQRR